MYRKSVCYEWMHKWMNVCMWMCLCEFSIYWNFSVYIKMCNCVWVNKNLKTNFFINFFGFYTFSEGCLLTHLLGRVCTVKMLGLPETHFVYLNIFPSLFSVIFSIIFIGSKTFCQNFFLMSKIFLVIFYLQFFVM